MKRILQTLWLIAPLTIAIAAAPSARAQTTNAWTGASGTDLNWSTPGNWTPAGPPGPNDDAIFLDQGATNDAVSINNIISADTTVESVWIAPTNGSTTNTEAFNTLIQPGVTLTVTGTNALSGLGSTEVLDPYENISSPSSPATYLVGTLDTIGVDTTVTNTITGPGGALILDNTSNILSVRQGHGSQGPHIAVLDMSGLDTFSANLAGIQVGGDGTTGYRRSVGALILAKTNTITLSGPATQLFVSDAHGNNDGNSTLSFITLGTENNIFADTARIGGEKCSGAMSFGSQIGSLYMRGSDGVSPVSEIDIGDDSSQSGSGNPSKGLLDLSKGTADILADTIYLGRGQHGSGKGGSDGTLILGAGTVNVNNLEVGYQNAANAVGAVSGTVSVGSNDLFSAGATLIVNSNLDLGRSDGSSAGISSTLNVDGGTVDLRGTVSFAGTVNINVTNSVLTLPPHSSLLASDVTVDGGTITNVDVLQASNSLVIANGGVIATPLTFDMGEAGLAMWDVSGLPGGGLTVSNTFSGAGSLTGNLTMAPGSVLNPGGTGGVQPLYLYNNLALNGATLRIDLSSSGGSGSGVNDLVYAYGNLTLGATNNVRLASLNGSLDTVTPYSFLYYGGTLTGNATDFKVAGPLAESRYTFTFDTSTPNYVNLNVGGAGAASLVWTGDNTANTWDLTNTADWNNNGSPDKFYNLDNVTFDDTGSASPAVNLAATLFPGSITMSNATKAYVFSSPGGFGGGSLTNWGSGGLAIGNDGTNNFNMVDVENGNVTFTNGCENLFGTGGLLVNSTLGTATVTIANTNANDFGPAGIVLNNGTLTFDQPVDATMASAISGYGTGTVTKENTNTLTLSADDTILSVPIVVTAGTLRVGAVAAVENSSAGVFVTNGGALDVNGLSLTDSRIAVTASGAGPDGSGAIVNNGANGTAYIRAFNNLILAGDTTFGGSSRWDLRGASGTSLASLSVNGNGYNITKVGTNEVALVYCSVDPTLGNIDVQEGEFAIQEPQTAQGGVGDSTKTITVHPGAMLETYSLGGDASPLNKVIVLQDGATIQNDSGASDLSGPITLQGNALANANGQFTFLNVLDGSGGMTKGGGSTLILSATNTYMGATVVSNGTLRVDGGIGGSGVDVAGGALAGIGSITAPVTVETNGALSPGDNAIGTLSVANTLTLAGVCQMDVDKTAGVLTSDLVTNVTTLTLGGTLQLNVTGDTPLAAGDSFTLYSANTISRAFDSISPPTPGAGLAWQMNGGVLNVVTAAPQGPTLGGVSVSGGNLTFNVSGGTAGATFYVLTSTNAAAPLSSWTPVATNQFDTSGGFSFTNAVGASPQQFFIIQLQ
ncbi:MAG: hypothetical protein KGJ60_13185 [Verrucomicrobiota bacterium]|nr:hypothetical protein [Verrucomicrobiota bacterium]